MWRFHDWQGSAEKWLCVLAALRFALDWNMPFECVIASDVKKLTERIRSSISIEETV
jgi:hypothetical protein